MAGSWSRGDKLAVLSLAIGVPLTILSFFVPEVRRLLGFDAPKIDPTTASSASTVTPAQTVTARDVEREDEKPVDVLTESDKRERALRVPAAPLPTAYQRHVITRDGGAKDMADVVAAAEEVLNALRANCYAARANLRAEQSTPDSTLQGLITTDLVLDVKLLSRDGSINDSFTIVSRGGGFSAAESALQGRSRLIDQLRRRNWKELL